MGKRGSCSFRERDVTRLVRAAIKAGIAVGRVLWDAEARQIIVIAAKPGESNGAVVEIKELDGWIAKHAHAAKGH
jgi:hypothetical protein